MTRRAFRIGGWLALAAGIITAAVALSAAAIGVLALTGKATFPVDYDLGPFSIRSSISTPVTVDAEVCQSLDVKNQNEAHTCFPSFMQTAEEFGGGERRQNPDVWPTHASLEGQAELATSGGWNALVAMIVARGVIGLVFVSAIFFLLWRLLAATASGEVFSGRTVRHLRGIGWLLLVSTLLQAALDHLSNPGQRGYTWEVSGPGPALVPWGTSGHPGGLDLTLLAFGCLILLLAKVFRHGAAIEAERRWTV